jgi:hypothetical protein
MNHWTDYEDELDPEIPDAERKSLARVAALLASDRPVPSAGFRGRLRRDLVAGAPKPFWRPRRLKLTIGAYAASGLVLLLLAAIGVAGAGPFASGDGGGSASQASVQVPSAR